MKIKSIRIRGMHKVADKEYTFNNLNYLVGKNGSGKSTVLDAIQLALLGYIPGSAKTNEGILKHASSDILSVKLKLEDDHGITTITRSWLGKPGSCKSEVTVEPERDLNEILKDIELPIFNFNEFTGMTANKMKDWFIGFLPGSNSKLDWKGILNDAIPSDKLVIDDKLIGTSLEDIDGILATLPEGYSALDAVRAILAHFKECKSYTEGRVKTLTGTLESLVYYDDEPNDLTIEELNDEVTKLNDLKQQIAVYNTQISRYEAVTKMSESFGLKYNSFEEDEDAAEMKKQYESILADIQEFANQINSLSSELNEIQLKAKSHNMLSSQSGTCPFTKAECESILPMIKEAKAAEAECIKKGKEVSDKISKLKADKMSKETSASTLNRQISDLKAEYAKKETVNAQLKLFNMSDLIAPLTDDTPEQIQDKIAELTKRIAKVAANNKYREMYESITKEKFMLENSLDIYKLWIKRFDANNLQMELSTQPFLDLEANMTDYLSKMFNTDTTCKFNLSEKNNSFSFGLIRDDEYLPFEVLSSGEKCLYTIALMMCIIKRSNSPLKLLVVDDLLDHLDEDNASSTFKALKNIDDIQIILAGVQPCEDETIMVRV